MTKLQHGLLGLLLGLILAIQLQPVPQCQPDGGISGHPSEAFEEEGEFDGLYGSAPRSPLWPKVRAAHLKLFPTCAVCGWAGQEELQVHHCMPFSQNPALELDPGNLITLCQKHSCHLLFGHLCSFKSWNAQVREDAATMLAKIKARP